MGRILSLLDRAVEAAIVCLMAVVVLTVASDVVSRYLLGGSLIFANELSRMCFIWVCFLGMPIGISKGLHVAITTLEARLTPTWQSAMFRLGLVFMLVLMVVVIWGAIVSIGARSAEQLNTIPVTAAWFYVPVAIGAGLSILHIIAQFIEGRRVVREAIETV
ncbi:TRAP transporter small permease [Rhizobium sp. SGZ-381]|uniref:TRAP transporter small permease n=1 Tax=Rhizobium sp. SGZ-381 TaxID=3342800 RepID=UPI003670E520